MNKPRFIKTNHGVFINVNHIVEFWESKETKEALLVLSHSSPEDYHYTGMPFEEFKNNIGKIL